MERENVADRFQKRHKHGLLFSRSATLGTLQSSQTLVCFRFRSFDSSPPIKIEKRNLFVNHKDPPPSPVWAFSFFSCSSLIFFALLFPSANRNWSSSCVAIVILYQTNKNETKSKRFQIKQTKTTTNAYSKRFLSSLFQSRNQTRNKSHQSFHNMSHRFCSLTND